MKGRKRGGQPGNRNALGHGALRGNRNALHCGAPRGNRNALKHGCYATLHILVELGQSNADEPELSNEICLLRAFVLRCCRQLEGKAIYNADDLAMVNLVNSLCRTIGTLVTRQAYITGKITTVNEAITTAILTAGPVVFPNLLADT